MFLYLLDSGGGFFGGRGQHNGRGCSKRFETCDILHALLLVHQSQKTREEAREVTGELLVGRRVLGESDDCQATGIPQVLV